MTDQANPISDAASDADPEIVSETVPAGMHEPGFNRSSEFVMVSSLERYSEQRFGQFRMLAPYLGNLTVRYGELREPRRGPRSRSLSPRERNILELIGEGRSNKEIARSLRITPETVKSHVKNIFVKLGVERPGSGCRPRPATWIIRDRRAGLSQMGSSRSRFAAPGPAVSRPSETWRRSTLTVRGRTPYRSWKPADF